MAIDSVRMEGLRRQLSSPDEVRRGAFRLLKEITSILNSGEDPAFAQELILLALEQKEHFGNCFPVLITPACNLRINQFGRSGSFSTIGRRFSA